MDSSDATSSSGGGDDRLSKLTDHALGHVLSFLPAEEVSRLALLSSRWRHVFAAVHTLSIEEPESPDDDDDDDDYHDYMSSRPPSDPNAPPSFFSTVSAAIIGRQRRRGAVPLRALRVAVEESYSGGDSSTVDQWVSYAVQHADAVKGLHLDLRLQCRATICDSPYTLRRRGKNKAPITYTIPDGDDDNTTAQDMVETTPSSRIDGDAGSKSELNDNDDDNTVVSSNDDDDERKKKPRDPWWMRPKPEYTVTRVIFSCAHLRSLSLSSCRLAPPDTVSLPSLVTLLLSRVSDPGSDVDRLVAGCPRLADLTLEACNAVTTLSVGGGAHLRTLVLRCCHSLTAVVVDSSELQAFEYRGAVPGSSFLTMPGGGDGCTRVSYCKVDICGEEAASEDELVIVNLRQLLGQFVNAKHMHLESARLGAGLDRGVAMTLPSFSCLLHLEMRGCLPDDGGDGEDTAGAAAIIGSMSTMLEHAPNLETLSLAFHPYQGDQEHHLWFSHEELLDEHQLSYNPHSVLATPTGAMMNMIPYCLRNKVREINLVHYQGSTTQRALAKFLLSNAVAIQKLWCEFAEGPMWTQMQLTQEIKGWMINKSADTHFA